jgi:hypothetical protein
MRKSWVAVVLLFVVGSASAGVQYEFRQINQSDQEGSASTECTGRAMIDGARSRVEFLSGNVYPPGVFVLTSNGSRTLTFVDPARKAFAEVNAAAVANAIGASKIGISNQKIDMTQMPDHPVIAGIPTDHYRLSIDYQITVSFGNLPLTQTVHTLIDKWTTMAFGDVGETFLSGGVLHTGNADIDDLVSAENTKIKGFALRQIVQLTTVNNHVSSSAGAKLGVNRTVTQTREMLVTSIQAAPQIASAQFQVPPSFHKADPVLDDTQKAPMQVLSMEPAGH